VKERKEPMKKTLCLLVFLCIHASVVFADFLESTPVGPGIIHHHEYREAGPWHLHVLEIDLSQDWVHLETIKAADRLSAYEKTSSMAGRSDAETHRVVGAINGDFYASGGVPIGAQVSYFGSTTQTNYWGTEITGDYLGGQPAVNDTISILAVAKDSLVAEGHGDNTIPDNGVVISGHGLACSFLNDHVFVGDTLSLALQLPPVSEAILQLIGGTPRLIRDGSVTVEWQNEGTDQSFATDRHPRTAVGFSQDSTKVYFITVDGRQAGYSVGMSLYELADYMLGWGIHQGLNLDGGGSTTMVVRGALVNSPSDAGGERTVANALLAISTAPTGPLAILRIDPREAYTLAEAQIQFSAAGFDQYYNPVATDEDSLVWSCHAALGAIDESGLFTAGNDQISGYVCVTQGSVGDSALVHITNIAAIELTPDPIILEIGEQQIITPEARDEFDNLIELSATDYQWSTIGDMGEISADGVFTAGISTDVIMDDFSDLSSWSLTGVLVNMSECHFLAESSVAFSPPSSGKLHYSLTTGGTSALYLNCSTPISGTPDAIGIYVYGDGRGHWLRGEFEDVDEEKFLVDFTQSSPGIDWTGAWRYLEVPLEEAIVHWGNPSATLQFPITWKKIYLVETNDAQKDSGTVFLDDFTASFIATDVQQGEKPRLPDLFLLEQNYPNPFNSETQIAFQLPVATHVKLKVYNTLGQHIITLLDHNMTAGHHVISFDGNDLASGVYLCKIRAGNFQQTRKMVLMK
jgi:hypothetical protein